MAVDTCQRLKLAVRGAVQGVGFRPFVFRLAEDTGLNGWVRNSSQGVFIEVEGLRAELERFRFRLENEKPSASFIQGLEAAWLDAVGYTSFEIRESDGAGSKTALVLPDIATCADCRREIFDPANRRYRYPFTNCTNCGPRFSIIEALPYDRCNTSMRRFTMCPECQAEYNNPRDRRFHAQPNACPVCGPRLELWRGGKPQVIVAEGDEALEVAIEEIRDGRIVAAKGLGGFHLIVDAANTQAVRRLRELKHREEKPFALMFPSGEVIRAVCEVSPLEERLLRSPEAPIVLLRRRESLDVSARGPQIADDVAPGNPNLGIMLPANPLHHLLMAGFGAPVVATSGNVSDEPICTDEDEALERLRGIADCFLVHDRPIVRHVDDSIVRVVMGRETVMRRARGYAPLPVGIISGKPTENIEHRTSNIEHRTEDKSQIASIPCHTVFARRSSNNFGTPHPGPLPFGRGEGESHAAGEVANDVGGSEPLEPRANEAILAVGAHLKNSVALAIGDSVFISQHIGDLETEAANDAFRRVIRDFEKLYDTQPAFIAADLHPEYLSTKFARDFAAKTGDRNVRYFGVQHHEAHVLACMAENELAPPVLGVAWDGTGYGPDGTIWGGEFFLVTEDRCDRIAHFRSFPLPGGDAAIKEPRRAALGLLYEMLGPAAFEVDLPVIRNAWKNELTTLRAMLERGLNSPRTSSAGRLFDAVASLAGLRQRMRYEGQAGMELEFALEGIETDENYPFPVESKHAASAADKLYESVPKIFALDWAPMIRGIIQDVKRGVAVGEISAKFHNTLAEAIVAVARASGQERVALSGGCFQNRYLTERTVKRLEAEGFRAYWHQRVPTNDGGIALGQVVAALRQRVR